MNINKKCPKCGKIILIDEFELCCPKCGEFFDDICNSHVNNYHNSVEMEMKISELTYNSNRERKLANKEMAIVWIKMVGIAYLIGCLAGLFLSTVPIIIGIISVGFIGLLICGPLIPIYNLIKHKKMLKKEIEKIRKEYNF